MSQQTNPSEELSSSSSPVYSQSLEDKSSSSLVSLDSLGPESHSIKKIKLTSEDEGIYYFKDCAEYLLCTIFFYNY
jgi:hypothetical protein